MYRFIQCVIQRRSVYIVKMQNENKCLIEVNPNAKQIIRVLFGLDQPGRLEEAITVLEEWIKKQDHFVKKDFSKDFLERLIIINKGLLERTKKKLDKICTLRTLMPEFFGAYNIKKDFNDVNLIVDAIMPKTTSDFYRIYFMKNNNCTSPSFLNYYRRLVFYLEYMLQYDYSVGIVIIVDYMDTNLLELIKTMSITELRQATVLFMEGYGLRVKGIHFLTPSKFIDGFVALWKQILSEKVANRLHVHKSLESLHDSIPKDLLPAEYGGKEKTLVEIHENIINTLSEKKFINYMESVMEARTDESRRAPDKFNEHHLGMPGSFRSLVVD
ncbi:alpha-tocopherol transfer protein-like [Galleria mellonella]|uniref:Alpha-tocopherol transfer protein-like n=1 Tax=Galleria mellonella TaxID=7137 RepID=A0A6J1WAF6_GALME|nr:alpha-tocopherol transfer protein-like [Galleria mellonella]